jgi:hypothetical protein
MPPVVKKTVSVNFSAPLEKQVPRAILLGSSGEQIKKFSLTEKENELSLDGIAAGNYTLRVEAGNEVMVEQIIIP